MGHAVTGCPGDLDATGRARWQLVREDIGDRWRDVYAATLERYVRALAAADAADAELHTVRPEEGKPYRSSVPTLTTFGSQGQLVPHPAWKVWVEAGNVAAAAADALGITLRAREKAGEKAPAAPTGSKFGLTPPA